MDESVIRGMARWPKVPAVYGWLALDRRGRWLLRGEPITHPLSIGFINRNYAHDEQGRWYFQNGPQRVYVDLHYTPWILTESPDSGLQTHTGLDVKEVSEAFLDEDTQLILQTEHGPGLIDDRSLPSIYANLTDRRGVPLGALSEINFEGLAFHYVGKRIDCKKLLPNKDGTVLGHILKPRESEG